MAARGSFQKRQKEFARKEKRQLKLERRQGRKTAGPETDASADTDIDETEQEIEEIEIGENGELVVRSIARPESSARESIVKHEGSVAEPVVGVTPEKGQPDSL